MSFLLDFARSLLPQRSDCFNEKLNDVTIGGGLMQSFNSILNIFYDPIGEIKPTAQWSKLTRDQLSKIDQMLDMNWEMLNVGDWKLVDICWRYFYTFNSLFKVIAIAMETDFCLKNIIKICDNGLLMGAPVFENILSKIAFKASSMIAADNLVPEIKSGPSKRQKTFVVPELAPSCTVPTSHLPSLEKFLTTYKASNGPVILEGVMDDWPATKQWSVAYLLQMIGHRTVPVEIGSKYTEDNWTQKLMTVHEFAETYILNPDPPAIGYLAQHELFDQIPELLNDISIPDYCHLGDKEDININSWFGPAGTVSPLHYDQKHNCLAQVFGEKYIRLYAESDSDRLYPHDSKLLHNTSQVDVEKPDFETFPLFSQVPYLECVLKAGQVLYIPAKHWHFVRSLSSSFSVSFWWE